MKKVNLSFFILLILFTQVIFTDTIIYFTKLNYIIANIIALGINAILVSILIKKKIIKVENNFSKWDLIFFAIILLIIIATIAFPDTFWDSYSYHIYLQENPFADKINNDFFPGRTLTSFVFPIADRMFYMFRALFGFRFGTIGSYLLLIVMYYSCKKILKLLINKKDIKERYISVLSILPLSVFIILQQLGTYYIDNFSVVLLLEFVYILLAERNEIFKNKKCLYYLTFIIGITICVKVTNAIYVLIPFMCLLVKNFKDIKLLKWYDYIFVILIAIIPILPYLVDNIIQTGSPVFPYYNTIFKSEYFKEANWLDDRYGPTDFFQLLIWPIYITIFPNKAYEFGQTDLTFMLGYIATIIYLICTAYKKIKKKESLSKDMILLCIILLYFYFVWAKFIIGYTRYAGIIAVLSSILLIKLLLDFIEKKKVLLTFISSGVIMISVLLGLYQYLYYGAIYRYYYIMQGNHDENIKLKDNYSRLFRDYENEKYDIDGVWGVIYDDSAVPTLMNVDDKLVHLEHGFKTGETEKSEKLYWDNVLNNDIYVPLYSFKFDGKLQYLDICKFEITEIAAILKNTTFLEKGDIIVIVKVKYNEDIQEGQNKEIFEKLKSEKLKQAGV